MEIRRKKLFSLKKICEALSRVPESQRYGEGKWMSCSVTRRSAAVVKVFLRKSYGASREGSLGADHLLLKGMVFLFFKRCNKYIDIKDVI